MTNLPENLDTPEFRAAWADWLAYRKMYRIRTYKPIGAKRVLAMLAEFGPQSSIEAIKRSMDAHYQGLFPKPVLEPAKGTSRPAKKVGWM